MKSMTLLLIALFFLCCKNEDQPAANTVAAAADTAQFAARGGEADMPEGEYWLDDGRDVEISETMFYIDPESGYIHLNAVLTNKGRHYVMVKSLIQFRDKDGRAIPIGGFLSDHEEDIADDAEEADPTVQSKYSPVIPPGGKTVLAYLRDPKHLNGSPVTGEIRVAAVKKERGGPNLTVSSFEYERFVKNVKIYDGTTKSYDEGFKVNLSFENTGTEDAASPTAFIIMYDGQGRVVDMYERPLFLEKSGDSELIHANRAGSMRPGETRTANGLMPWTSATAGQKSVRKLEVVVTDL